MLSTIEEEEFEKSAKIVASYLSYIIRRSFPRSFNSNKNVCCLFFSSDKGALFNHLSFIVLVNRRPHKFELKYSYSVVIRCSTKTVVFQRRERRKNSQCTISVESDYFLSLDGLTLSTAQIFFSFNLGFNIFQPELWINFVLFTNLSE